MSITISLVTIELLISSNCFGFSLLNIKNWDSENNRALVSLHFSHGECYFDLFWINILKP